MPLDQVDVDRLPAESGVDETEMSFLDHLEELRWHLVRAIIAIFVVGVVLFIFHDWFFDTVLFGPRDPNFPTYQLFCAVGEQFCFTPPEFGMQAVGFAETFVLSIKVCFIMGFVVAFPYVFYQIWSFVAPGLYEEEKKATSGVVFVCSFLFMLGVLFGYFVIAPFAINFLMGYELPGVTNIPTVTSYVNYMVMFTLPAGMIFELPIVVYFLAKLGLITAAFMRQYRRHAFILILVLSALVTPPDVVTQFLIGIPLYFLYEISIFIARRMERKREAELAA